jgi:hypothetical protein
MECATIGYHRHAHLNSATTAARRGARILVRLHNEARLQENWHALNFLLLELIRKIVRHG